MISRSLIPSIFTALLLLVPFASAHAAISSTADTSTPVFNGEVDAIVRHGNTVYVGGDFTKVNGNVVGAGLAVSSATAAATSTFPMINGNIESVISDRHGGWYVGGSFTKAGGLVRNNIVHILSSGAVDSAFDPNPDSGEIDALALSPNGATLYVGGDFTTIGGQSRTDIAALNTSDGTATSFDPEANRSVTTLALSSDGSILYAGGDFQFIGGQAHFALAALNTSDGTATSFDPEPDNGVFNIILSSDGATLYAGGNFQNIAGQARNYIAALNTSDGTATSFDPEADDVVTTLALSSDNNTLYAGGHFLNIGGQARSKVAALNTSDGTATSFDPNADGYSLSSFALSSDGTTLYVGGSFDIIGGQTRNCTAALKTSDGTATSFDLQASGYGNIVALSPDGSQLFVGGDLNILGGTTRNHIAAFSANDGSLLPFDPNADDDVDTLAVSPDGTTLYAGGFFSNIGGQARNDIAAFNTSDGTALSGFDPNANAPLFSIALSPDGTILYAGGRFSNIGGQARNEIAALSTSDGSAIPDFDPNADNQVYTLTLSPDAATLYAGGLFTNIGGQARNRIAALNTSDGSAVADFDPESDNRVSTIALSQDGTTLYTGGDFSNIGGKTRNDIAALNTSDGTATSFDPEGDGNVFALALSQDGTTLYAGGEFSNIGGQARNNVAALNTSDGTATSFDPEPDNGVFSLVLSSGNSKLYVGGDFSNIGGSSLHPNFASFSDSSPTSAPTLTTSAATALDTTVATLHGDITATGGANATARGFVWGTTTSYGATTTESGSFGISSFTANLSSLTCNTTYDFRSYATNTAGTSYGGNQSFTTSACPVSNGGGGGGGGGSSGGGGVVGLVGSPAGSYKSSDYIAPRPQIIYPDGHVVYLDTPSAPSTSLVNNPSTTPTASTNTPTGPASGSITTLVAHNYQYHDTSVNIRTLQQFLNAHGFIIASAGAGSPGHESTYFGSATLAALKKFQKAHGLPATGYFGPLTRGIVSSL